MTGILGLISDLGQPTSHPHVMLVDGSTASFSGLGTATRTPTISLSSVLYVPKFPHTLVSRRKLIKTFNSIAIFLHSYCIFQDLLTSSKIGGEHGSVVCTIWIFMILLIQWLFSDWSFIFSIIVTLVISLFRP